jgi:hypothetical protein
MDLTRIMPNYGALRGAFGVYSAAESQMQFEMLIAGVAGTDEYGLGDRWAKAGLSTSLRSARDDKHPAGPFAFYPALCSIRGRSSGFARD